MSADAVNLPTAGGGGGSAAAGWGDGDGDGDGDKGDSQFKMHAVKLIWRDSFDRVQMRTKGKRNVPAVRGTPA
jgi:hypothetical protein